MHSAGRTRDSSSGHSVESFSHDRTEAEEAVLQQVLMVWEFSSLKAVQYMERFIRSHCRALEIPVVLDQAVELHRQWNAASDGDTKLKYSRVINSAAHTDLNHAKYPDLYYAAVHLAKVQGLVGANFQVSSSHPATQKDLIDKYVNIIAAEQLGELSQEAIDK